MGLLPIIKSGEAATKSHAFAIGRNVGSITSNQPSQAFAGAIDDVIIFERALTPVEIPALLAPSERLVGFPAIELEFFAKTGTRYQLQLSEDLVTWTNEGPNVLGANRPVVQFVSTRSNARRYWRLQPASQP